IDVRPLLVRGDDQFTAVEKARHRSRSSADFEHALADIRLQALPDPFVVAAQAIEPADRLVGRRLVLRIVEDAELEDGPNGAEAILPVDLLAFPVIAAVVRDRHLEDAIAALRHFRGDLRLDAK